MAEAVVRFGVFPDWKPLPRPASLYWLGARVEAAKIKFFGFFRTEEDALAALNSPPR